MKSTVFARLPRIERCRKLAQTLLRPLDHLLNHLGLLRRALLNLLILRVGNLGAPQLGTAAGRLGPTGSLGRLPTSPCFLQGDSCLPHYPILMRLFLDLLTATDCSFDSWVLVGLLTSRMDGCLT